MRLPGRLRTTSVGDLLGTLHRGRATGTLEIVEDGGRRHSVHVAAGLVVAVEIEGSSATLADFLRRERAVDEATLRRSLLRALASRRLLGEVLVHDFHIAPTIVGAALRRQIAVRLHLLERLGDAQILFRVAIRTPRGALTNEPLEPTEFLAGRRRARDRGVSSERPHASSCTRIRLDPARAAALAVLGVAPDADGAEIKRAYRRLARDTHPDLHPGATEAEKRELALRFCEATSAYRSLVA